MCQIKQCQIKINKHDSEHLIFSKCYLYGAPRIMNFKNKSVLDIEFANYGLSARHFQEASIYHQKIV